MIKVLFTAAEAAPFVKTGGLADVASSLPKALKKMGIDVRVMIPNYSCIPEEFKTKMKLLKSFDVPIGIKREYCGILFMEFDGVTYYFIDNEHYFRREGIYGFYDDGEKFAYFDRAILESIKHLEFKPDIIHLNDWHTGMVSPLLKRFYKGEPEYSKIKTIFTIHNLRYQGIFSPDILEGLLGLSMEYFNVDALEFYGGVSFMKGGINYSDIITTVSRTYAEEIQTPEYGERLEGLLAKNNDHLHGIVNGIDYKLYNPLTDNKIFAKYSKSSLDKKTKNKLKLQELLNFPLCEEIPLIGMVTRLAHMKGIDLVLQVLDEILSLDVQMVILGTGESYFESKLKEYASQYPDKLSVNILFDDTLAHRIYAASDIFLMPSRFEPCGLSQLIALRYGSIPIVRETGGLKDTVIPYNESTGEGNGFSFTEFNGYEMLYAVKKALVLYKDKEVWAKIVKNAMERDYSWKNSACIYKELYEKLVKELEDLQNEG